MTRRVTVSVPDDIASWLDGQGNVSGAVTAAVRKQMEDAGARAAKRRTDAAAYAAWMRTTPLADDEELTAASNEISMRGLEW